METSAFYLASVVLLQIASECSCLEWEFGRNSGGSKTILEKDGIIPSFLLEKRVTIGKQKCIVIVYVKVEVEDMPTVTYNMGSTMVTIKFGKGRRTKNTEFRVTAKGVKDESPKCRGIKPMPTNYPDGKNPYVDGTPYFQFSNEYYQPSDAPNHEPQSHEFPYDITTNNAPNDAHPDYAHPDYAQPNYAHPDYAHPNDAHPNDAHPNDAHTNDAYPNDAHPNDAHPNHEPHYNEFQYDMTTNNAFPNDAYTNYAYPNDPR